MTEYDCMSKDQRHGMIRRSCGATPPSSMAARDRRRSRRRLLYHLFFGGVVAVVLICLKLLHRHSLHFLASSSSNADNTFLAGIPSFSGQAQARSKDTVTTAINHPQRSSGVTEESDQNYQDPDKNCIFRNSSTYRKVFVYPTIGDENWKGDILSEYGKNNLTQPWPWLEIDKRLRQEGREQYAPYSMTAQFSTELLVREILTHPQSCLQTTDPEQADLFYIPYLPSVEFHAGKRGKPPSFRTSPYAQAILDAIEGKSYSGWEQLFGWTSKYWKRRKGADHILVFSEPLQGLTHPKSKRGNYHFIHTQRQLNPPIVISVELSTTFVEMYPKCAAKNILMPYPINDGRYYNGALWRETQEALQKASLWNNITSWTAALPTETELYRRKQVARLPQDNDKNTSLFDALQSPRPFSHWLKVGLHRSCTQLRQSMNRDYKCTKSFQPLRKTMGTMYAHNMRMSTFCPCPGGDTASAKRMFDAVLAGCIPIVLSYDFVWPLSTELEGYHFNGEDMILQPSDFSLRWDAQEFTQPKYDPDTCNLKNASDLGLEERLQQISASQLLQLRQGLLQAAEQYSYYRSRPDLPENPLQHGVLPDGGAAHALVAALGKRTRGSRWSACAEELSQRAPNGPEPTAFVC